MEIMAIISVFMASLNYAWILEKVTGFIVVKKETSSLLIGGDKASQDKDIKEALECWRDYHE
jgi:hypothetical protein